jgi:chaperonin GroEL
MLAMNLVTESKEKSLEKNIWNGYNLKTEQIENLRDAGIIDPTKVTRIALESAASVAGTILLTECVVVEDPSDKEEVDPMAGMMNSMM